MEGPSKAEIAFEDRKDGSSGVSYIVQEPGESVAKSCLISLYLALLGFLISNMTVVYIAYYFGLALQAITKCL